MQNQIIFYQSQTGSVNINVTFHNESFWLTQKSLAQLFGVDRTVVTKHLKNVFETQELNEDSVCAIFTHTAEDGKNYKTNFYNLDAIIAVGYRVNSKQATQFRIWATNTLKEFIIKGFVLNDEMLKNGRRVMDVWMHYKTLLVMVKRSKIYFIPRGNTQLEKGDSLLIITDDEEAMRETQRQLGAKVTET